MSTSPQAAASAFVPSPLEGEGSRSGSTTGMGEGSRFAATPHPIEIAERLAQPSPTRGEGATTTAPTRGKDYKIARPTINGAAPIQDWPSSINSIVNTRNWPLIGESIAPTRDEATTESG